MEYKTIDGLTLPVLAFGTGAMGPNYSVDPIRDEARIRAIKAAIENGITHIDTAERYGGGRAEELVGEAIKGFDRDKLFITSKVSPQNLNYGAVIDAARRSEKRLGTYIDLYLVHAPNPAIPLDHTMLALDDLVDIGTINYVGVSNFSTVLLEQAREFAINKLVACQIEYSLLARNKAPDCQNMESEIIPYCRRNHLFVIAYKALARGQLAKPGNAVLDSIAAKYGKTQGQVALNWLISQKNIIALTQAIDPEHLNDSLGALGWKLDKEDVEVLSREMKEK